MKKFVGIMVLILCLISTAGCKAGEDSSPKPTDANLSSIELNIGVPKAPPALPILRMMETGAMGDNVKMDLTVWENTETAIAMAADDKYPILAVPVNVGAQLYNKGMELKLANVSTWGVIYLASSDKSVKELRDLKGQTLYVALKGAPPDILTQYLLQQEGITPGKDIELVYAAPAEIAQLLAGGKIQHAVNIEPFIQASKTNNGVHVVNGYGDEWKKQQGEQYDLPNAGIAFKDSFIKDNKEIAAKFQEEYAKALEWTVENPQEAGALAEKYLGLKKELIEKSMPNLALKYKNALESKPELEKYYEVLLAFNPESIGGKLPDKAFYYEN